MVVVKNRRHALGNPVAVYGGILSPDDVLASAPVCAPLRELEISPNADGAVVLVLASEEAARRTPKPVWIRGVGWASGSPWLAGRSWGQASYAGVAAAMAYRMAGITQPDREIRFAEIDDTYAYKELQHLEAAQLAPRGEVTRMGMEGEKRGGGPPAGEPCRRKLGMGYWLCAAAAS